MQLKAILTGIALLVSSSLQGKEKPNILFILADDLGYVDLSCTGSQVYETPNIDQLVKDGMIFNNAYASHPRCVPSRYSIFSGRIPGHDGVPGFEDRKASKHTLPLSRVTWGELLKGTGYSTGYIGKWHLGKKGGEPDKQGFTDSRIANSAGAPPSYFYPFHESRTPGHGKEKFLHVQGTKDEYLTDRLTEEALDFIEKNQQQPFALVLAHYAVHTPLEAPGPTVQKYSKKIAKMGLEIAEGRNDKDFVTVGNGSSKTVQNNPTYAAMIEHMDRGVGKIRARLDELGIADNTVIVFTSDHGGLSTRSKDNKRPIATTNLPYRCGKGWLYEGGVRVPHIVVWPGKVKPSSKSNQQTLGADHYQSILDIAGITKPEDVEIDGCSYVPALLGKDEQRSPLFFHSPLGRPSQTGDHAASALIVGDWKIFQVHETGQTELYNLKEDPGEKNDLSHSNKDKFQQMAEELSKYKKQYKTKQRYGKESSKN